MFKKLKWRFLALNMVIISALLLASFCVIYFITESNVRQDIRRVLDRMAMEQQHIPEGRRKAQQPPVEGMPPAGQPQGPPQGKLAKTITAFLTEAGDIDMIFSGFDLEENEAEAIVQTALAAKHEKISYEGSVWEFRRTQEKIVLLDISSEQAILYRLIRTFLLIALVALGIIFLISWFFSARAIAPIEAAWEKQKQFVADASHEIKTPLTTIRTNVDVLLSHPDSTVDAQKKWIYYIKNEADRMAALTEELLCLARLDSYDKQAGLTAISFSDAVESIILTMEAVVFEKELNFDYLIQPDIKTIADEGKLKQLVMILLDNAVKYTPPSGKITVNLEQAGHTAKMCVENTGVEIPSEEISHIFDRFFRTDKSRARDNGGYGLGLAIAQSIVHTYRGHIFAESSNGRTRFTVELPAVK